MERICHIVQLKNAFLFKKQYEKTDLFFGDYLKWLKEQESSTGEVELTPNLTGDESVSGSSPGKSDDKNMDYIKVRKESFISCMVVYD